MFIQGHIFILLACHLSLKGMLIIQLYLSHKVDDLYTTTKKSLLLFSSTLLYPPREPFMCMDVNEISLNNDEDMHS